MYSKPFHPWHNVSPGKDIPNTVNGIIEIPKGSKGKYELDKESGLLRLDRVLYSSVHYPANYGFIPQTYCDDKDPLDILVICSIDVDPLCLIESKVIGFMQMIDDDEQDDKIVAVANNDNGSKLYERYFRITSAHGCELRRFFEDYKKLEHKQVIVEQFLGREEAYRIINEAVELYNKEKDRLIK